MRISVLTSSRADYGIYRPLLRRLKSERYDLNIIAFGTHVSHDHGYTLDQIKSDGFEVDYSIETVVGDSPKQVAESMANTMSAFAGVWEREKGKTDLIISLGDRYEMFAAVSASVPFAIPVAHIHGGETTLGAIDNVFRHSLTLMSRYHFTSAEAHRQKVVELIGVDEHVYNVGSLSLDNLEDTTLLSVEEFEDRFEIDLKKPTVLVTFHPETVSYERNYDYAAALVEVFEEMKDYQIVITLPNADTMGNVIREAFIRLADKIGRVKVVENFGVQGYFSAMKHSRFLLGNTSSGIIEAASFQKYVVDVGDRQKGRTRGANVIHCALEKEAIMKAVALVEQKRDYTGDNIYHSGGLAAEKIMSVIKKIEREL